MVSAPSIPLALSPGADAIYGLGLAGLIEKLAIVGLVALALFIVIWVTRSRGGPRGR